MDEWIRIVSFLNEPTLAIQEYVLNILLVML